LFFYKNIYQVTLPDGFENYQKSCLRQQDKGIWGEQIDVLPQAKHQFAHPNNPISLT